VAVHVGIFTNASKPVPTHFVKSALIWLTVLLAFVTAALNVWAVLWTADI
jgi:hypothetical protein